MINCYFQEPFKNKINQSFDALKESIQEYQDINSECYIFDYFSEIRNKVDLHREELIKKINDKSEEIIKLIKEKEVKCKQNERKIDKMNYEKLLNQDLPLFFKSIY